MSGPARYAQYAVQSPPTSAGPNDRAGFIEVPLTGAAHSPASAGAWTVTPTTALAANATYTAQASQPDGAGNVGTATNTFVVDTVKQEEKRITLKTKK